MFFAKLPLWCGLLTWITLRLGVINDVIDLVPAACYYDGGESRGKAAKAAIMLLIPFVFAAYWWCRRAKVH